MDRIEWARAAGMMLAIASGKLPNSGGPTGRRDGLLMGIRVPRERKRLRLAGQQNVRVII